MCPPLEFGVAVVGPDLEPGNRQTLDSAFNSPEVLQREAVPAEDLPRWGVAFPSWRKIWSLRSVVRPCDYLPSGYPASFSRWPPGISRQRSTSISDGQISARIKAVRATIADQLLLAVPKQLCCWVL